MKIIADMHTHTSSCDHAFSTINENCGVAAQRGNIAIAVTEHTSALLGAPSPLFFFCGKPKYLHGVRVLNGAEVNILGNGVHTTDWGDTDYWRKHGSGNGFDLPDSLLSNLDYVIASMHDPLCTPHRPSDENTARWLEVLENPHVDCLGHIGNGKYPCDYRVVVEKAAKKGVLIEINNHSFKARAGSAENCRQVAKLCMELGARIVVSSDAHWCDAVGDFPNSLSLLDDIGFPDELVVNADETRFRDFFAARGVDI